MMVSKLSEKRKPKEPVADVEVAVAEADVEAVEVPMVPTVVIVPQPKVAVEPKDPKDPMPATPNLSSVEWLQTPKKTHSEQYSKSSALSLNANISHTRELLSLNTPTVITQ